MSEDVKQQAGELDCQDMSFGQRELTALPWFKFWPGRWIGSATVQRMSMAERGMYITILAYQWILGSLPRDKWQLGKLLGVDCRSAGRWLETYAELTEDVPSAPSQFTLPKLAEFAVLSKKSSPDRAGDKNRRDKKRIDSSSATRKRMNKETSSTASTPPEPELLHGLSREEQDRFLQGYGRADCTKCMGRGNYFLDDPQETPVPRSDRCDCIPEPYR